MVVDVPLSARTSEQKILSDGVGVAVSVDPSVARRFVRLSKPTVEDLRCDLDRLIEALPGVGRHPAPLNVVRRLPGLLRQNDFGVTAVVSNGALVGLEPGDASARCLGVAFDIGTTTIVGVLLDLATGADLGVAARTNPQIAHGDDVVSRIQFASMCAENLAELQSRVAGALNEIMTELCAKASVAAGDICRIVAAGNTTMEHLLLGIDPTYLAQAPYVAAVRSGVSPRAAEIGLMANEFARIALVPNIAGFVGGDTVAGILATDLHKSGAIRMLIDIGTNGEIVAGSRDRLVACSCAAGPAFEGMRISRGMRAMEGAIERVLMPRDVEVGVIGRSRPTGICGTGLIDAVAELLRWGIVDETGRIQEQGDLPQNLPEPLRRRVIECESAGEFVLVPASECGGGHGIHLTQKDIREVQLAKAAVFTGIQVCKKTLGVSDEDIEEVMLAGAFGNYIRREMARRIGLLPDMPISKIRFVGNSAGAGAKMALASRSRMREAEEISLKTEYLELAANMEFQEIFADSLFFATPKSE